MSAATRTIQQPAATGSLFAAVGLIALILATALAVAVGSASRTTSPVAAPAPIHAPAVRDLGARDPGSVNGTGTTGAPETNGYHGFGGPAAPATVQNGSNQAAPAVHRAGLRPS